MIEDPACRRADRSRPFLRGAGGIDYPYGLGDADVSNGGLDTDLCDYVAGVDVSQVGCE